MSLLLMGPPPVTRTRAWYRQLTASLPAGQYTPERFAAIVKANIDRTAAQMKAAGIVVP